MRAGYATADITPKEKITLCGFVARRNKPFTGIGDRLSVHALVAEEANTSLLILSFDLLGLGKEITTQLHQRLDSLAGFNIPRQHRVFCCTHTHSAPATIKLIGCGIIENTYVEQVIATALRVALKALTNLQTARLRTAKVSIPGANYNRRQVLEDGRVAMNQNPDARIRKVGPTWDDFLFLRFEDEQTIPILGIANWAAHPCTVCSDNISGDYPAELCRQLSERFEMPFMYLQGACGDLNPPFREMTHREMLENVGSIMKAVSDIPWGEPIKATPFAVTSKTLRLIYQPIPALAELEKAHDGMKIIAEAGNGPEQQMRQLANILNMPPGQEPDSQMMRYTAAALMQWNKELIEDTAKGKKNSECDLLITVWRIGNLVLCFIAAEVFVESAIAIRNEFPDLNVIVVGYSSPLVGYLPTDEALDEGGYEVDYAYRFYGHHSAFAKGNEPAVVKKTKELIESLL
jgi:neutral ceramidase